MLIIHFSLLAGVSEQGKTTLVGHGDTEGGGPLKPKVGVLEINLLGVIYCKFFYLSYTYKRSQCLEA